MSEKPTPLTKRLQWRVECLFHSLIESLAAMLPGSWVFHIGECLAAVLWYGMPKRRRTVIRNLRIACAGSMEIDEIRRLAKASFVRSGANLLSAAHTASLSPSQLGEVIEVENLELLQDSLNRGKGVVLLLSHMGNWELLSRLIHFFPEGAKAGAMYRPLNNEFLDERVCRRRQADGTRMFSKRDPFHQITGFLREGGIVGVLVDQRVGVSGDLVRFFGRLTKASPLPSLLARRSKSDVLALSLVTDQPGKWRAKFTPVEMPPSTENCIAALEMAMREGIEDVFWLQDRWRLLLSRKCLLNDALQKGDSDAGKGYRALIWMVGCEAHEALAERWIHPDVTYELALAEDQALPDGLPDGMPIHRVHRFDGVNAMVQAIERIDALEVKPLDYLLTYEMSEDLRRACKRECVSLYDHGMLPRPKKAAKRKG